MKARILDRADVSRLSICSGSKATKWWRLFAGTDAIPTLTLLLTRTATRFRLILPILTIRPNVTSCRTSNHCSKSRGADGNVRIEPTYEEPKRAVFGIRSCDVAGIYHLDLFYLGGRFRDIYYEKHRQNLFLVNLVCTDPDRDIGDECFCVCADTGPAARGRFDLQLMDLGEEFMAVAGTPAGEELLAEPDFPDRHGGARRDSAAPSSDEVRKRFKTSTSWFSATVRYVSQGEVLEKTWEEIGNRCMECGGCTYVCPACTCFTVSDRSQFQGSRAGTHLGFLRAGRLYSHGRRPQSAPGGARPPKSPVLPQTCALLYSTGTLDGLRRLRPLRRVCHGDIGMPSVVEIIRRATAELDTHEHLSH